MGPGAGMAGGAGQAMSVPRATRDDSSTFRRPHVAYGMGKMRSGGT